jgi:hypothetical protein
MVSRPLLNFVSTVVARPNETPVSVWVSQVGGDEPEIGDVDEGIVERGEDTSNAEDELACDPC